MYFADGYEAELRLLIECLPTRIQHALQPYTLATLTEVVMDLGRPAEARFLNGGYQFLSEVPVEQSEIDAVVAGIGMFSGDNRAGIPRTLHRISALRNRQGHIVGLTCRVGKVVLGTIEPIKDIVLSGKSILLLGPPGVGKTTKLREIAKLLADEALKRVMIVDTSNEIAGDGDIPHRAVGLARRIQVPHPDQQQAVMIEAVENHTPQVIVVDEIGTEAEAEAARTIAERGVTLVATAHGTQLENLIKNPVLSDLIGGIQSVTLGDEEAKRRSSQKTILEREKQPTFDVAIEIRDRNTLAIYPNVAEAIDHLLRGWTIFPEVRKLADDGSLQVLQPELKVLQGKIAPETFAGPDWMAEAGGTALPLSDINQLQSSQQQAGVVFKVFLYSVTRSFVEQMMERLDLARFVAITNNMHDADAVLALRGSARPGSKVIKIAMDYQVPLFYAKTNTMAEIHRAMREAVLATLGAKEPDFARGWGEKAHQWLESKPLSTEGTVSEDVEQAMEEVKEAIETVLSQEITVELAPRRSYIRRLQHELVERHRILSVSVGDEPNRRLKLLPRKKKSKSV